MLQVRERYTFIIPWSLLPMFFFFFFGLCNSVSSLPSDLLSLFIYINAFTLPQIFYLKWNKPALQLPFCFSRWFFLFFSFTTGMLELHVCCGALRAAACPGGSCLPRALACTLLGLLEILFQEFSLSFPRISFFCSSSYPE